ncbi:retinol dehydrogenase 12 [Diaporthe amygdali]|uniref:retinol dehydrogenase 12 n=1 Tax=Phomopsis amygdali TaxID=1214568 RepID=UPI0022FDD274|nr:retinol dehydrogenase 12 [Diaporthe amygdali]KAJ0109022.1 retinol dehydrogenase 12 [Diaporthe amygdali]
MDTVTATIHENFGGTHSLANEEENFSLNQVPDLNGKVAIVTGGSQGIGYGCTRTLLEHNISKLFIISQSSDVATDAINTIREELGDAASARVEWKKCNLGDWKAVTQTAEEIKASTDRIDLLINNAARGIMTAQITPYGVDEHMAINHFGHVILTSQLLPTMKETAKSGHTVRIVNLGSNAHQNAPKNTKFASLDEINKDNGPTAQYGRSKLAAMLYARYLATHVTAKHPNILANSVHPGFVDTKATSSDIHEAYPLGGYMMSVALKPFQKSQFEGCVSAVYAATVTDRSGKYICIPARIEDGSELAQSNDLAEQLMQLTEEVLKDKMEAAGIKYSLEFY